MFALVIQNLAHGQKEKGEKKGTQKGEAQGAGSQGLQDQMLQKIQEVGGQALWPLPLLRPSTESRLRVPLLRKSSNY